MAVSDAQWDGSASNYEDAASYCQACLINENTGDSKDWTKDACSLPYKFPNGDISRNGCHSAASVLAGGMGGVKAAPALRKSAARKLLKVYTGDLKEDPPDSLKKIAGQ